MTTRAFRRHEHSTEFVVARSSEEATQILSARTPGLILIELGLPNIDGLGLLRQIRAESRLHLVPIVVLSASYDDSLVHQCYAEGANSFVRKPADLEQLMDALRQVADYWLAVNFPCLDAAD